MDLSRLTLYFFFVSCQLTESEWINMEELGG